eukprot:UN01647
MDPYRTGRTSGIIYCWFGITLVAGPKIADFLMQYCNVITAYSGMIAFFLIPSIGTLFIIDFPEHKKTLPDFDKLFTTPQNIIIILLYAVAGMVFIFGGYFQSGIMEYHGRSEHHSINVWAIFNILNPIPRLGIGIAMDSRTFGVRSFFSNSPRNVMSGVYT